MSLPAGSLVGRYEVRAPLGAGGMGEVYRAWDAELQREVALKLLPESLADSPHRLKRLRQEARITGQLNHPNILAIYDVGEHGGRPFLVSELLEGETLRARLQSGSLPVRKAIEIGTEIARGLAAAHERGVVHRDLKPENVFLTGDGRVKVLDFGLAKESRFVDPEAQRTLEHGLVQETREGVVMGTAGYMSPEQVRGQPLDHRSDVFSFGIVLFEMFSGSRPFVADSVVETMSAILQEDPPSLGEIEGVPPAVERVIRICLEKRPEERFQSAHDLALALGTLSVTSTTGGLRTLPSPPSRTAYARPMRRLVAAILAGGVLLVTGFFLGRAPTVRPAAAGATSFERLTEQPGVESSPSLFPDGSSFVFVSNASGNADVYLQRVGGHNPINLTARSKVRDATPEVSPDGSAIVFYSERNGGGIFVMGATGESPRRLTDHGFDPSWSPDGSEIVVSTEEISSPSSRGIRSELWAVRLEDGHRRLISRGDAVEPAWSPDGRWIAYWGVREGSTQRDLWLARADGSTAEQGAVEITRDVATDWAPAWAPDGRSLYFASDRGGVMNLWQQEIHPESGRPRGKPRPLPVPTAWAESLTVSADGSLLAYAALEERSELVSVALDPEQGVTRDAEVLLAGSRRIRDLDLSPDGSAVVFSSADGQEDLYVVETDGTGFRQLTDDAHRDRAPRWGPDGKRVVFYSDREDVLGLWSIDVDGSGLQRVDEHDGILWYPHLSLDGSRLVAADGQAAWILPLDESYRQSGPSLRLPTGPEPLLFEASSWSPDGSRLAGFHSPAQGTELPGVFVYSFEDQTYRRLTERGGQPLWLSDSRRLLYKTRGAIRLLDPVAAMDREVFSFPAGGSLASDRWSTYAVSEANDRIVFSKNFSEADVWLVRRSEEPNSD